MEIIEVWPLKELTQAKLRELQRDFGVSAYLIEMVFWHLDTLHQLSRIKDFLVFKGGTCVQSYLPEKFQRASNDLDFNTTINNPNALMEKMAELNEHLEENNNALSLQIDDTLVPYGHFEFEFNDARSGTLSFKRRMPSRLGEYELVKGNEVLAKSLKVQINYKHAWLPAMKILNKHVDFFINKTVTSKIHVKFPHESVEDLISDKIIATSNIGQFGRERFKDIYDLMLLSRQDFDGRLIIDKIRRIVSKTNLDAENVLKGAVNTISTFAGRYQDAQGFASMVCYGGKELIKNWEVECESLADRILELKV